MTSFCSCARSARHRGRAAHRRRRHRRRRPPRRGACTSLGHLVRRLLQLSNAVLNGAASLRVLVRLEHLLGALDAASRPRRAPPRRSCRGSRRASSPSGRPASRAGCAPRSPPCASCPRPRAPRRPSPSSGSRPRDRPDDAVMVICCSLPVPLSLAVHVDDAVGVDVEGDLDLRHAARRRRDAVEVEACRAAGCRAPSAARPA